jgi:hypothetical protein
VLVLVVIALVVLTKEEGWITVHAQAWMCLFRLLINDNPARTRCHFASAQVWLVHWLIELGIL